MKTVRIGDWDVFVDKISAISQMVVDLENHKVGLDDGGYFMVAVCGMQSPIFINVESHKEYKDKVKTIKDSMDISINVVS